MRFIDCPVHFRGEVSKQRELVVPLTKNIVSSGFAVSLELNHI